MNPAGIHFGRYRQDQKTLKELALFSDPGGWVGGYLIDWISFVQWYHGKVSKRIKSRWPAKGGRGTTAEISLIAALNIHTERETERQTDRETERQRDLGFS